MDGLLTSRGKSLPLGGEVRFTLIKGPTPVETKDPIHAAAPSEIFPVVAKFAESVVKPDFTKFCRFYQQDIPSQKDDSDEEADPAAPAMRKKRRYRRNEGPRRQWMLQTEEDYLVTMIAQREQGKHYKQDSKIVSSRYEGLPEHSASQYVLLSAHTTKAGQAQVQVTTLPTPYAVHAFSQPAKVQTMSMTQAEQAIEDQRKNTTRYMMHKTAAAGATAEAPKLTSKHRLLDKLKKTLSASAANNDDDDGDDVMADIKFSNRKGTAGRARKELLSSMADGVAIDADGVMGGAHDAEFGGKRRFMKLQLQDSNADATTTKGAAAAGSSNDGMAMADDFYQRDVKAEYEELDYDANEQFDDDDVDLGEGEMNMDGGFADDLDDGDEDGADDDEDGDEDDEKKAGLASLKGLKDMLKKARGEVEPTAGEEDAARSSSPLTNTTNTNGANNNNTNTTGTTSTTNNNNSNGGNGNNTTNSNNGNNNTAQDGSDTDDKLADVMAAAAAAASASSKLDGAADKAKTAAVRLDEFGQRILSMDGVRYEIFLNNKSIAMKKLMKLYNIKKKSDPQRIQTFQLIIKELCTMEKDPVQGNILKLKQHYQKGI